jgi:hypothetical protein
MVADNFLCSAAVTLFWFTSMQAQREHERTEKHHGHCLSDTISRSHMGRDTSLRPPLSVWVAPLGRLF